MTWLCVAAATIGLTGLVAVLAPPLLWLQRHPRAKAGWGAAPQVGQAGEASRLLWRATWVTVLLRTCLVVALGLTPLGAAFVRWVAPSDQDLAALVPLPIIGLAFVAVTLVAEPWRRQARALAPQQVPARSRRARVAAAILAVVGGLVLGSTAAQGESVTVLVSLALALYFGVVVVVRRGRVSAEPTSGRLQQAVDVLGRMLGSAPPTVVEAVVPGLAGPVGALDSRPGALAAIVVRPAAAERTDPRHLACLLAHEVAHLRRGDITRARLGFAATALACVSVALWLAQVDALQRLADVSGELDVTSGPLLLATGYLTFRALQVARLWSARATESRADLDMVVITGDPDGAADALDDLLSWVGAFARWTRWQYVLVATHPAWRDRVAAVRATSTLPA